MESYKIKPLTAKNVLNIFGGIPTKGQLMKLCEGIITPFQESAGQGTTRFFDFKNLVEVGIWKQLHQMGAHSSVAKIAVEAFNNDLFDSGKSFLVLSAVSGRSRQGEKFSIKVATWDEKELGAYLKGHHVNGLIQGPFQNLTIINLKEIRSDLRSYFGENGEMILPE